MQVEDITDAVGEDTCVCTRGCIGLISRIFPVTGLDQQMIKGKVSDINTSARSCNAVPGFAGVLKSLVYYIALFLYDIFPR